MSEVLESAGVQCPKCGHRQVDPEACHRCGLVFAMAPVENPPWEAVPAGKEEAVEEFERRWVGVREAPDDAGLHEGVAAFATEEGIQEWAIRRYRFLVADLEAEGQGAEAAAQALAGLVAQVQARARALLPSADTHAGRRADLRSLRTWMNWGLVVLCALALIALIRMIAWTRSMQLY